MPGKHYHTNNGQRINFIKLGQLITLLLYPDSGIPIDEEIGLGNMIWSYSKAKL